MEHARNVVEAHAGANRERELYNQYPDDLDAYINAACSEPEAGMMCNRCKKKTVFIELKQTRSADEGMTAYATCSECKYSRVVS